MQREVAVEREERERGENDVELAERRRAAAAQRIDVEGERQAHAVGEQLAGQAERVEHDLQREAERHADQQLLRPRRRSPARENGAMAGVGHQRRDQRGDGHGEHDARARRHEARAEHRRHHQAGADAREREEALRHPAFELSGGES